MPDCLLPTPFGERLSKLRATTITFTDKGSPQLKLPQAGIIMALTVPWEEDDGHRLGQRTIRLDWQSTTPVLIEVKPGVQPALEGIQVHLKCLKDCGIIVLCQSPWNTLLLPVPKSGTKDYRPVQDLRLVDPATVTLHPPAPNPYMLLGSLPAENRWFTYLYLKNAFFSIGLTSEHWKLFAFQWRKSRNRCNHPVHLDLATPGVQELSHHL
ncbi:Gag-Pol polyprotein [Plecturocebus cupreus]